MIEFKIKHSNNFNPCIEWSDKGTSITHFPDKDINPAYDVFAIQQINKMAEYMMDRAKKLHNILSWETNWEDKPVHNQKIELDRILSILKDAGVEVIENKCLSCSAWGNVCGPDDYPDYIGSTYNCEYFTNKDGE